MLENIPTVQQLYKLFSESTQLSPGKHLENILQIYLFKFPLEEGDGFSIKEINADNWQIDLKISHGNRLFTVGSVYLNHFSDSPKASITFSNAVVEEMVLQKKSFADTKSAWNFSPTPEEEALAFINQYRKAKNSAQPYLSANLDLYPERKQRLQQEHQILRNFFSTVMTNPKDKSLKTFNTDYLSVLNQESPGEMNLLMPWLVIIGLAVIGLGIYGVSSGAVGDKLFVSIGYLVIGTFVAAATTLGLILFNRDVLAKREIDTLLDQAQKLSPEVIQVLTQNHSSENESLLKPEVEQPKSGFYHGAVFSQKNEKGTKVEWPVHYSDPASQVTATL